MVETLTLILPFFFVFAIVYGSLEVSSVFKNNAVKAVIALVLAFFTITNQEVISFINETFPYIIILFVVVFFLGFIFKLVKGKGEGEKDYVLLIIIVALVLLFLSSQGDLIGLMESVNSEIMSYIGLGLILVIFYAAYEQMKKENKSK
ncbi:MAG: hypothetical protein ABIH52_01335 [Candidatus Aenigmatarchaeota archaeon]|nr:hypothetical protein [Nanoarchaeota archaeon]